MFLFRKGNNELKSLSLSLPPSIRIIGLLKEAIAAITDSIFVAFESL